MLAAMRPMGRRRLSFNEVIEVRADRQFSFAVRVGVAALSKHPAQAARCSPVS